MENISSAWSSIKRSSGSLQASVLMVLLAGTGGDINASCLPRASTGADAPSLARPITAPPRRDQVIHLHTIRSALRLSVTEMAQLFAVTRPTIYSWQSGNAISPAHAHQVRKLADALEPHLALFETQIGRIAQRAIDGRTTLLQMLSKGAEPDLAFGHLATILNEETAQSERLSMRLRGRNGNRGAADLDALS